MLANVWPFPPESGYSDTYQFLTEVLRTYTSEQRLKLRKNCRRIVSINNLLSQEQLVAAKKKARRYNQTQKLYVPLWSESELVSVGSSDTSITLTNATAYYTYNLSDKVIIWNSWDDYVVKDITELYGAEVRFSTAVGSTYSNAQVMPLRECRALQGFAFSEMSVDQAYVSVDFTLVNKDDYYGWYLYDLYSLDDLYDTEDLYRPPLEEYNGIYVRKEKPYRMQSIEDKILKPITIVDNGFGPIEVEPQYDYINNIQSLELWSQNTHSQQWDHEVQSRINDRDFALSLEGKITPFYLPTFNNDITILSGTYSGSTIDIDGSEAETEDFENRVIMVENTDGTTEYYTIQSVSDVGSDTYRLDLGVTSVDIDSTDVDRICFMNLVRSDTDEIVIRHGTNTSSTKFNVREVPN